ncbi:MAG: DMT family protein [Candidatus Obscuribacterales bacterium]|nr:DMT family protein [Candidatus Obscuribacterales bacterium]
MQVISTIVLLTISNIFMTFAWYGHLKFKVSPLWLTILASWGIAFFEYCFQVPANRIGSSTLSTAQLKIMQEAVTLIVFSIFSLSFLHEPLRWNYLVAFGFIVGAVYFVFASK